MDKDTPLNLDVIEKLIKDHQAERSRILLLKRYYNNMNRILNRQYTDINKPMNKLSHNYAAYITDNYVGYMVGKPITYKSDNIELLSRITDNFLYNDEIDTNTTLAQEQSICGYSYDLLFLDEDSQARFKCVDTENLIAVYDNTLEENIMFAILYSPVKGEETTLYIYDKENEYKATLKDNSITGLDLGEGRSHGYLDVPIDTYENNRQRRGDFEKHLSNIDAYDQANSDTANDFEYFTNALLIVNGVTMEEKDEEGRPLNFKDNRVLNFATTDGDAKYLIKNINDTALENYKDRLNSDIHKFSSVVDMSDEKFAGNLSGVAIRYKLNAMENVTSIKEAKFRKGLMRRIELLVDHFKVKDIMQTDKSLRTYLDIKPVFTRNIPSNDLETVNMVKSLNGIVSDETLLAQIPFIDNPQHEIDKLNEKENRLISDYDIFPKGEHLEEAVVDEE
jgi:SPP1 family phage portal protein